MSENIIQENLRPVAFMVMPFRERNVLNPPVGAPSKIDCDALWDRAFRPALEDLGYLAIRADIEVGAVIVKDMFERLALADLVLADMTLPNGNVYYEVGLRHVAKRTHCVLIAAEWSKQLFDTDQIRTDRYPLKNGSVPEEEAKVIRKILIEVIPEKKNSPTPYYELVTGKGNSTVFWKQVEQINAFQTKIRAIRFLKNKEERQMKVRDLIAQVSETNLDMSEVSFELFMLVRDSLGWEELLDYFNTLPTSIRDRTFFKEQILLSQSKLGDHITAIEGLKMLIELRGESAERRGLMGGRYKRLWREARDHRQTSGMEEPDLEEIGYLDSAIENYSIGMELDYNEYFCACNLPALLRARGDENDDEQAAFVDNLVVRACERKLKRGEDDGWVKPTLLVSAFQAKDVSLVKKLAIEVARQGPDAWKLKTTLNEIEDTINKVEKDSMKSALEAVRNKLTKLKERT